jgi:uncharacterized protein (TIGR00369 family)
VTESAKIVPWTKEAIDERCARSPFLSFLGLRAVTVDTERQELTMRMPFRPEFQRGAEAEQWHGGIIAAAIDTVGDYGLAMLLARPLPTVNFRVDYLRPAARTELTLIARVRRNGRSVGVVDVEVLTGDAQLVAIGRAVYSTLSG